MSLIHDALKTVDGIAPAVTLPRVTAPAPAAAKPSASWLSGLAAFMVVVTVGGGVYWLWLGAQPIANPAAWTRQPQSPTQTLPQAPTQMMEASDVVLAQDTVQTIVSVPIQISNFDQKTSLVPDAETANVVKLDNLAPASASLNAPAEAVRTAPATRDIHPSRNAPVKPAPNPAPVTEPVDDTPVELHFGRFVAAMRVNDIVGADGELALLRKRLPEGALGLVRAQAWFDLKSGREDVALMGYQSILDRLPGDEEAAINTASVHSQRQQSEQARSVLAAAVRINPDSAVLRDALNQFAPAGRP